MKRCPRCDGQLAGAQVGAVRVDGCPACGGVWFDNTELGTVANTNASDLLALEDEFLPGPSAPSTQGALSCPECRVGMYAFAFPHAPDVRLDACPSCKGIWADDGELQALYSWMTRASDAQQMPDPRLTARQALGIFAARRCPGCGVVNTASNLLCRGCGAKLAPQGEMLCPNCDVALNRHTYGALMLESCSDCTGVWLEAGELSLLAQFPPEELQRIQDGAVGKRAAVSTMWKPNPTQLCPRCCVGMVEQEQALATGVRLDTCERCHGVWVDAGELVAVSRHFTQSLTRRRPLA